MKLSVFFFRGVEIQIEEILKGWEYEWKWSYKLIAPNK
jgi:hypothetical protein